MLACAQSSVCGISEKIHSRTRLTPAVENLIGDGEDTDLYFADSKSLSRDAWRVLVVLRLLNLTFRLARHARICYKVLTTSRKFWRVFPTMASNATVLPLARKDDLIVKELVDEVLVYDSKRSKAFCLNKTSSVIWKSCDGKTSIADMSAALHRIDPSIEESVVWFALKQLEADGLLDQPIVAPVAAASITRSELMKRLGIAAALIPFVATLVAPTPAKAYSTIGPSF